MLSSVKIRFPFSAFTIKMVALITMVIDHFAMYAYGYGYIDPSTNDILRQIVEYPLFYLHLLLPKVMFIHQINKNI